MGAKLGAILCGSPRTAVDACGIESLSFRAAWTAVDTRGQRLEIYGSEGWGFESLRACQEKPPQLREFLSVEGCFLAASLRETSTILLPAARAPSA